MCVYVIYIYKKYIIVYAHTLFTFLVFLLCAYVYIFLVSTYIFMIPKAIISIPNFSLICLIVYFFAQGTLGYQVDTWQIMFGKLSSLISYLSKIFCCIFLGLATSKLLCP